MLKLRKLAPKRNGNNIRIGERKTILNLAQFSGMLRRLPEFAQLRGAVGLAAAEEVLKDMHFDYLKHGQKGVIFYNNDWNEAEAHFARRLNLHREKAQTSIGHINRLFQRAMSYELAKELHQPGNIMPQDEYGATDNDIDCMKGAKWIVHASTSNKMGVDAIYDILMDCCAKQLSVFKLSTLEYLHERIVPRGSITPRRPLNTEQPWSSSGAAKVVQHKVAQKVGVLGERKDMLSGDDWDNLACFFLGAYTRAHGFPDGNGRPNRALYVLTLIQGFRPFVAPQNTFTMSRLTRERAL